MSEKGSVSSPSLERAETLQEEYHDHDVFGHEEEHDVRDSFLYLSASMLQCP